MRGFRVAHDCPHGVLVSTLLADGLEGVAEGVETQAGPK